MIGTRNADTARIAIEVGVFGRANAESSSQVAKATFRLTNLMIDSFRDPAALPGLVPAAEGLPYSMMSTHGGQGGAPLESPARVRPRATLGGDTSGAPRRGLPGEGRVSGRRASLSRPCGSRSPPARSGSAPR